MQTGKNIQELEKIIADQDIEIKVLKKIISTLKTDNNAQKIESLRIQLRKQYEAACEQLYLFDEFETSSVIGALEETPSDVEIEVSSYIRRKAKTKVELPCDTPVVDVYDDSVVSVCERCGSEMKEVGEKVFETFTRIQRTVVVRRHVKQFSCTKCIPDNAEEGRIIETAVSGNILDGTICDPTLLAQIIENKFSYAQPLYRQALAFQDIGLTRSTISSWIMKVGKRLAKNMTPCLVKDIESYPLLNIDETPVKVVKLKDEDGNPKAPHSRANAFMIIRSATDSNGRSGPVMFTFTDNRRNETIYNLVKSYTGVVQTDGLQGYANAESKCSFVHLGCMVHARRKAVDACGKKSIGPCYELVKLYAQFFHLEGKLRDEYESFRITESEYLNKRREVLTPCLEAIKKFCQDNVNKVIPSSATYTAFNYPLERWDSLERFLDYSFATSSNQKAENGIRPFVVGRKNWLFCITELGAEVSSFFYSLIESCKAMDINVQDYLTYLFFNSNTIEDGDEKGWTNLLPDKIDRVAMVATVANYRQKLLEAKIDFDRTEPYRLRGKRV